MVHLWKAIVNYMKQKELEKWQRGVEIALADQEYMALTKELDSDNGEIYEC